MNALQVFMLNDDDKDLPSKTNIEWLNNALLLAERLTQALFEDQQQQVRNTDGCQSGLLEQS